MMNGAGHVDDLVGVYALGALPKAERAAVETHLAKCARCRELAADARSVVSALPLSADPVTPSPDCKRKLFERISAEPAAAPGSALRPASRSAGRTGQPASRPWGAQFVNAFRRLAPGLAAAGLVLALAFGAWSVSEHSRADQLQAQMTAQSAAMEEQRQMLGVLAAPDLRAHALTGSRAAPSAWGKLYVAPRQQEAVLMVYDLPPCPPGQVYEFWMVHDQTPVPMGTFTVDRSGAGHMILRAGASLASFQTGGVSIEPEGGNPSPTGEMVLASGQ